MGSGGRSYSGNAFGWELGLRSIGRQLLTSSITHHRRPGFETGFPETPLCHEPETAASHLPLGEIPEDAYINTCSYLTAPELCAVRCLNRQFLETAERHGEDLWGRLCCRDFPSMARAGAQIGLPAHQQYIRNVMLRAEEELGNLRSTLDVRKSLEAFISRGGAGIIGIASDIASLPDPRIARAVSHKRRAALWSVVVTNERVIQEFRRRGLHRGPLNFLPIRALQHDRHLALSTAATGNLGADRACPALPMAPELPEPPAGFLGFVVRLIRLRPEHEHLRWTFFFAVFRDLMVFESAAQAEALRARRPNGHLFYCSLDQVGEDHDPLILDGEPPLPHIGHWGFRPLHGDIESGSKGNGDGEEDLSGAWARDTGEAVDDSVERLRRTACYARSSLAFVRWR
ncbi:unnamed protein product [Ascophyllum nodosum]